MTSISAGGLNKLIMESHSFDTMVFCESFPVYSGRGVRLHRPLEAISGAERYHIRFDLSMIADMFVAGPLKAR